MRVLTGVLLGVAVVLLAAAAEFAARGLESGALVRPDGVAVALVGPGWAWVPGLVLLGLGVLAVPLLGRLERGSWVAAAVTVLVLVVAGAVLAATAGAAPSDAVPTLPVLWLTAAASSGVTWVAAGLALALGVLRARTRPVEAG